VLLSQHCLGVLSPQLIAAVLCGGAAKAVAYALTPGLEALKLATIWPKKEYITAVEFKTRDTMDSRITSSLSNFKVRPTRCDE
jgi:outer membrane lipoprotein-sorting protein